MDEATNSVSNGDKDELWKRFSEWVHCICVVTFDLELGQAMEVCIRSIYSNIQLILQHVLFLLF